MGRFLKHVVVGKMLETGLVPVFYNDDLEISKQIIKACVEGGARVVEFTDRGDQAHRTFSELAKWCERGCSDAILGVGSVTDPETAALYINSGANFVVSPVFSPDIARICNRRKTPYSPGCGSASEISRAEELGVDIVKLFPSEQVGEPVFIKNLMGSCPSALIMPTGDLDSTREGISAWIKAGAACLGIGSSLITEEFVAARDFSGISKKVEECIWWIKEARGTLLFKGIEHIGLYATDKVTAGEIADWYITTFEFTKIEGASSFFLSGQGPGRIEIMKKPENVTCHIAIRIENFEMASKYLEDQGIDLEEAKIKAGVKAVFLRKPDIAGNRIHLLYLP